MKICRGKIIQAMDAKYMLSSAKDFIAACAPVGEKQVDQ